MSSSSVEKSSTWQTLLKSQNLIYFGVAWCVLALLFFLLFSIKAPGEDYPMWYQIGTYIFECGAFLFAGLLCYRNWSSPQIASGRNVWLGIGLGMFCYFLGGLAFGWWELFWKLDPQASPADIFYIFSYLFLGWGMLLAVLPRRLNLEAWQWGAIAAIAILGIAFAAWVTITTPTAAIEPVVKPDVPGSILATENLLNQFSRFFDLFYIIGDVILLIIAATLLLAFWGGKFSQSWKMLAAATIALYIADMWFKYAATLPQEYESGALLEVFFIFSGVLFGIGAALEYDVSSSRPARGRRRRNN